MAFARRRLVQPDRAAAAGEDAFRFDHVLIRDAAYAAITKGERARLHERLARWLDERGELDEIVGHHLEQAALYRTQSSASPTQALPARQPAGSPTQGDARSGRPRRPRSRCFRARSRSSADDTRLLELELDLGTAIKFSGDIGRAGEALEEVAAKARATGNRRIELRTEVELYWARWSRGAVTSEDGLRLDRAKPFPSSRRRATISPSRARTTSKQRFEDKRDRWRTAEAAALRARDFYQKAGLARS